MDLIERLQIRLNEPLPGYEAHRLLAPYRNPAQQEIETRNIHPRLSGVMTLLYPKDGEWHIVLTKRNEYQGTHSAQVSFPGGRKDEDDPDLIATSIRETKEEIGVSIERQQVIGCLSEVYIPPSNFLVSPCISWLQRTPDFQPDPREVQYIIEFPVKELLRQDIVQSTRLELSTGLSMKVPYFDIKKEIVWGATAVILSEFREVLKSTT